MSKAELPMPSRAESATRREVLGTVLSNTFICREHYRLEIAVDAFAPTAPGQFVQLKCRNLVDTRDDVEVEWVPGQRPVFSDPDLLSPCAVLRRPFSLAGRREASGSVVLSVIHRVVGIGTAWLERLSTGDRVSVLGPLGNRFALPEENGLAVLVGGGVGIPPMLYLAEALAGRKAVAFCGAVNRSLLPLTVTDDAPPPGPEDVGPLYNVAEFAVHGIPVTISTDDGSYGFRGYVTQALEEYLDRFHASRRHNRPMIYTCGPELMLKRVADIAERRGLACQVAVERAMACGLGTCQSCVIKLKTDDGWRYRLACTEGPVFTGTDLMW